MPTVTEYGLVKKAKEKLENQISNFKKLECEKSSNINKHNLNIKVKGKLTASHPDPK